jgi:hypothetical protein
LQIKCPSHRAERKRYVRQWERKPRPRGRDGTAVLSQTFCPLLTSRQLHHARRRWAIPAQRKALFRGLPLAPPSQRSQLGAPGMSIPIRQIRQHYATTICCTMAVTCVVFIAADFGLAGVSAPSGKSSGKFGGTSRQHAPGKTGQGGTGSGASPGMGSGSGMGSAGSGHSTPGGQSHSGSTGGSRGSGSPGGKR